MEHLRWKALLSGTITTAIALNSILEQFCYSLRTLKRIIHTQRLFRQWWYIERDSVTIIKECVLVSCQPMIVFMVISIAVLFSAWTLYQSLTSRISYLETFVGRVWCWTLKDVQSEGTVNWRGGCTFARYIAEPGSNIIKWILSDIPGPNDVRHLDQNDKLRRYRFCLRACIDGYERLYRSCAQTVHDAWGSSFRFSCMILWLGIASSNCDPQVICKFFLTQMADLIVCKPFTQCTKCVYIMSFDYPFASCPCLVLSDYGTENSYPAAY